MDRLNHNLPLSVCFSRLLKSLYIIIPLLSLPSTRFSRVEATGNEGGSVSTYNLTSLHGTRDNVYLRRRLQSVENDGTHPSSVCDQGAKTNLGYQRYFRGMSGIYSAKAEEGTCLPVHRECGWPSEQDPSKKKPLFVISVGLEGAGHHLWTKLMDKPVFDCVWTNGRHYHRDIGDGVPRTTVGKLKQGLMEQLKLRVESGQAPCKTIFDAEDSFPTGAIRKAGRVFNRPDLVNLQMLDGILFDIKYLVIARNVTDTALSALRRNFFSAVDPEIRTVEHTLTYIEAALRAVPCHKIFIAHYEHALADPPAFLEPLSTFLELDADAKKVLKARLSKAGQLPPRKVHKLTQYSECNGISNEQLCYNKISNLLDSFFQERAFMWPTFGANGFDVNLQ